MPNEPSFVPPSQLFSNLNAKQRAERARVNREMGNPAGTIGTRANTTSTNPSGKKFKKDLSLRMDNLSDEIRVPTEKDWEEYNEWNDKREYSRPNKPNSKKVTPGDLLNPANIRKQNAWKHGIQFKKKYRISSPALNGLRKLARRHSYGHDLSDARQAKISDFIRALANPLIYWEDTRDDDIKATDEWRLTHGRTRLWCTTDRKEPRLPREFTMTNEVIESLYRLACKHMTFLTPNPTVDAVLRKGTMIASLLEIIGRGWLTPRGMPSRPDMPQHYRYRKPFHNVFIYGPRQAKPPRI